MTTLRPTALTLALGLALTGATIQPAQAAGPGPAPHSALARMPVKEVTIFKDGHALLLHAGKMPTDPRGDVLLDDLPAPVLGTFWPYANQPGAKLSAVTAGQRKVRIERTALNMRDLIEANVGAEVVVTETPSFAGEKAAPLVYSATIQSVPEQGSGEREQTSPPGTGPHTPVKGSLVILKTDSGVKAVPIERIADVTFEGDYKGKASSEEFRTLLTLDLDWEAGKTAKEADVGMMYVQRGLRWIPNYKVTIDGKGQATVALQATLINEITDLEGVTAHLVVGVPTFYFHETLDPIALGRSMGQLSQYFQSNAQTAYAMSNAIMSQQARMGEQRGGQLAEGAAAPIDLGPEIAGSGKTEDLFIFTVERVSLKKGERMVLPVTEFTVPYRDVYTVDIPIAPPPEVFRQFDSRQQAELAQLFAQPKVMHQIRLTNKSQFPFTTAPALVVRDNRVLAQGLMTYTAAGSESDLDVTAAVDTRVKETSRETGRNPNAEQWHGDVYGRVDLEGTVSLTHFGDGPREVEVTRHVLGTLDRTSPEAKVERINVYEQGAGRGYAYPAWWASHNWPYWWHHFNPVGKATWTVKLEPSKPAELRYQWHYYWRP